MAKRDDDGLAPRDALGVPITAGARVVYATGRGGGLLKCGDVPISGLLLFFLASLEPSLFDPGFESFSPRGYWLDSTRAHDCFD